MRNGNVYRAAVRSLAGAAALLIAGRGFAQHEQHTQHEQHPAAEPAEHALHEETSEHAEHGDNKAPALPAVTEANRAAAFPDLSSTSMSDMMIENPLNKLVLLDELEVGRTGGEDRTTWDLDAWIGRDLTKLWLRSEGERSSGDTERADLEILYGRSFAPWWDLVAGVRTDFAPGSERSWAAVGVRGLAPYRFDVEATAYFGDGGRTSLRVETAYEVLVTNKLILEPSIDVDWYGRTEPARGIGAGLSSAELGVRLRYEVRREIAPYVGLLRERSFGRTADLARATGAGADDTRLVAGFRGWF